MDLRQMSLMQWVVQLRRKLLGSRAAEAVQELWAQFKGSESALPVKATHPTNCIVTGRLATDPERGERIATFALALRSTHDAQGAFRESTAFCQVTVLDPTADHCMRHLTRGKAVTVTGTVSTIQREVVKRRWLRRKRRLLRQTAYLTAHNVQFD